jgi:hypothetical protein
MHFSNYRMQIACLAPPQLQLMGHCAVLPVRVTTASLQQGHRPTGCSRKAECNRLLTMLPCLFACMQVEQQASSGVSIKALGGPQSQEQQPHLRRRASSYASSSKRRGRLAAAAAAPSSSEEGEEAEDGADSPTAGSWVASKPELAASHVLRALDAWLDEV